MPESGFWKDLFVSGSSQLRLSGLQAAQMVQWENQVLYWKDWNAQDNSKDQDSRCHTAQTLNSLAYDLLAPPAWRKPEL